MGYTTYLTKDAKEDDPQNEQNQIPNPNGGEAQNVGNAVEHGGKGGEAAYDFSVDLEVGKVRCQLHGTAAFSRDGAVPGASTYPFGVSVNVCLARAVELDAVKRADRNCQDELGEMQERKEQIAQGEPADRHFPSPARRRLRLRSGSCSVGGVAKGNAQRRWMCNVFFFCGHTDDGFSWCFSSLVFKERISAPRLPARDSSSGILCDRRGDEETMLQSVDPTILKCRRSKTFQDERSACSLQNEVKYSFQKIVSFVIDIVGVGTIRTL